MVELLVEILGNLIGDLIFEVIGWVILSLVVKPVKYLAGLIVPWLNE